MSDIFNNSEFANIIKIIHTLNNPRALATANANPIEFFAEHGVFLPNDIEYEIHLNDNQNFYFVIQSPPNAMISDDQMRGIVAAKLALSTIGSSSSMTSASCYSCPISTVGSFTTAATLSTVDIPAEKSKYQSYMDRLAKYQNNDK